MPLEATPPFLILTSSHYCSDSADLRITWATLNIGLVLCWRSKLCYTKIDSCIRKETEWHFIYMAMMIEEWSMSMDHSGGMVLAEESWSTLRQTCPNVTLFTTNPTCRSNNKVFGISVFLILLFEPPLYTRDFVSRRIVCKVFYDKMMLLMSSSSCVHHMRYSRQASKSVKRLLGRDSKITQVKSIKLFSTLNWMMTWRNCGESLYLVPVSVDMSVGISI
jgi:hypothetical protein